MAASAFAARSSSEVHEAGIQVAENAVEFFHHLSEFSNDNCLLLYAVGEETVVFSIISRQDGDRGCQWYW